MNSETGKQLVKSAAAILCVAGVCISTVISSGKIADMIKSTAVPASVSQEGTVDDSVPTDGIITGEDSSVPDGEAAPEQTNAPASGDTVTDSNSGAPQSAKPNGSAGSSSSSTTKKASGIPQSKAEIINYCNTALNKAKAAKVGYNKKMVREVKGSTEGIPSQLIKLVAADKNTTMKKGDSKIKDDFPAAGFDWSSKLREKDVANATLKPNGQYYEIRLTLGKEQNPSKGEASSYGRVMSVIDAAEAGNMVPGIKSINMSYHDGYVYAKVDSKTGRLVSAEFSAKADIQASIKIFGDISVKDIVSTETFTNFVW